MDSWVAASSALEKFLLTEYDNLAQAHFKMVETISEFFKHYLAIVTIPTAAVFILPNLAPAGSPLLIVSRENATAVALLFFVVAVVGAMLLGHVANLRMDALLYARAINGIRKFFYEQDSRLQHADQLHMRALPQSPQVPGFGEFRYFGPVVLTFGAFDTFYFILAMAALLFSRGWFEGDVFPVQALGDVRVLFPAGLFLALHALGYYALANYREGGYLRSNLIGVDIDGVLNRHRDEFASVLGAVAGKSIDPERITVLPVRDVPGLGVSKEDEVSVFNTPGYWTEMPVATGAASALGRLRAAFCMKVYVFTSRPWPLVTPSLAGSQAVLAAEWVRAVREYYWTSTGSGPKWVLQRLEWVLAMLLGAAWLLPSRRVRQILSAAKADPIGLITRRWLRLNGFPCDRLVIERAGEDVSDPRARFNNRFHQARTRSIRFFVEDDPVKARKLAYVCDIVFLLEHPYNKRGQLPSNVVRVTSWSEIYDRMKEYA